MRLITTAQPGDHITVHNAPVSNPGHNVPSSVKTLYFESMFPAKFEYDPVDDTDTGNFPCYGRYCQYSPTEAKIIGGGIVGAFLLAILIYFTRWYIKKKILRDSWGLCKHFLEYSFSLFVLSFSRFRSLVWKFEKLYLFLFSFYIKHWLHRDYVCRWYSTVF